MINRTFVFLILFSFSKSVFCQNKFAVTNQKQDSLVLAKAKIYFEKENYQQVISLCENIETSTSYILLAKSYEELGDFYKAINYHNKIIFLNKDNKELLIKEFISIAKAYKKIGDKTSYLKSIEYSEKALQLTKFYNVSDTLLYTLYNNNANYYRFLNRKKALKRHEKALNIAIRINDSSRIANSFSNISAMYANLNSSKEELKFAKDYIKKSLQFSKSTKDYNLYRNLGIVDYLLDSPKEAILNHNKALEVLLFKQITSLNYLPSMLEVESSNKKKQILSVLFEKYYAWMKYYFQEKDKTYLANALETIETSDHILDELFKELTTEKSQLYWRKQASHYYLLGVHISELINKPQKAFYFTEKNKAILLLDQTIENKLKKSLPTELLKKENKIKKQIYSLQEITNKANSDSLKNLIFDRKIVLEKFTDSLKTVFPDNFINKENRKVVSLKEVQNMLKENTLYISYIWDKTENQYDALYGIAIDKSSSKVFKIHGLKEFSETVKKYADLVSKPFINEKEIDSFKQISFKLYNKLLPETELKDLLKSKQKLIIAPDNDLQNIPFESLISNYGNSNYLINDYQISYAYSISFLINNSKLERKADKIFCGYAPVVFKNQNLNNLIYSKQEISNIIEAIGGNIYLNSDATKNTFFETSRNSKIIHIASHANANDSITPWISFSDKKLNLSELYTYKNQADLVFLSACNSSLGEISSGEGVFSLARGFFYSGANSVISSLWNVNDKSNTEITTSFYSYLKEGKTKSASLRQAKLDYLNSHTLSEVSPYYWSSLILIGDDSSLKLSSNTLIYIILGVLLLVVLFFILKKLKSRG